MNKILFFLCIFSLSLTSCKKDKKEEDLPKVPASAVVINGLVDPTLYVPDTINIPLQIIQSSGIQENITLSADSLPANLIAEFSAKGGIPAFSSTLKLITVKGAIKGSYPIKIIAKGTSGATKSYRITVTIMDTAKPIVLPKTEDTTYLSSTETPQSKSVFIEEFSGASCTNCPDGYDVIEDILSSFPGRIVVANYHTYNGGGVFKPVGKIGYESKYDFRDSAATQIGNSIFMGVNSIPTAGVDRAAVSGSLQIGRSMWKTETSKRLSLTAAANIHLSSSYNSADNTVHLKVKVVYTKAVNTKNILTLGVTESNIVDAQEYPDRVEKNYVHNHIFRKCLTPSSGRIILDAFAVKEAGRVYEYAYSFTPKGIWNLDNCKIIAVLSNNEDGDKSVIQAQAVSLK